MSLKENTNKFIPYDAEKPDAKDVLASRNASWIGRPMYRTIWREGPGKVYKS